MEEHIEIIISELDFYLIQKVRSLRTQHIPRISQTELSQMLGLSDGFVSKVENIKEPAKYNLWHLNRIARILELKSYLELFPNKIIENDIVKMRLKISPKKSKNSSSHTVILTTPLTEEEMQLWKANKLSYLIEK